MRSSPAARVRGYKDRPWLQRRVRLQNRVGRKLIRWGRALQDDANSRVRRVTAEYVQWRDANVNAATRQEKEARLDQLVKESMRVGVVANEYGGVRFVTKGADRV